MKKKSFVLKKSTSLLLACSIFLESFAPVWAMHNNNCADDDQKSSSSSTMHRISNQDLLPIIRKAQKGDREAKFYLALVQISGEGLPERKAALKEAETLLQEAAILHYQPAQELLNDLRSNQDAILGKFLSDSSSSSRPLRSSESRITEERSLFLFNNRENDFQELLRASLGAKEDPWSDALQKLRKAFQKAPRELQDIIKEALPWVTVKNSSLYLWPPDLLRQKEDILFGLHLSYNSISSSPFKRLQEIIEGLAKVLKSNKASSLKGYHVTADKTLKDVCEELKDKFGKYEEDLYNINSMYREFWCFPVRIRTELSDQTLLISQRVAKKLLNIKSCDVLGPPPGNGGSTPVIHLEDIYAKQSVVRHDKINTRGPAMEWAMSTFHRLLFAKGKKPNEKDEKAEKNEKAEESLAGEEYVSSAVINLMNVPLDESPDTIAKKRQDILALQQGSHDGHKDIEPNVEIPLHEHRELFPTQSHLLQVTPEVKGKNFAYFAKRAQEAYSEECKKGQFDFQWKEMDLGIDLASAQRIILSSFLTCPADAKADNLIVTDPIQGKRYIVSIDNDWALAPTPATKDTEATLEDYLWGTRQVLWAIPQFMDAPLIDSVREVFLSRNIQEFLNEWIKQLMQQQVRYNKNFDPCFVSHILQPHVPVGSFRGIQDRFEKLQAYICQPKDNKQPETNIRCHDLLAHLSQPVANRYKTLREQNDPLQAFEGFYEDRRVFYRTPPKVHSLEEEIIRYDGTCRFEETFTQAFSHKKSKGTVGPFPRLRRPNSSLSHTSSPSDSLSSRKGKEMLLSKKTPLLKSSSQIQGSSSQSFFPAIDSASSQGEVTNPRVQDSHGWTRLHRAVFIREDPTEVYSLLVNEGADVKQQTARGMTALHLAVYAQNKDICRVLLKRGVSRDDETAEDGKTVEKLASQIGFNGLNELIWEDRRKRCGIGCAASLIVAAIIGIPLGVVLRPQEQCLAGMSLASLNGTNGFNLTGVAGGDWTGFSVSGAGDVNGDGIDDMIIGAPQANEDAGTTYVVFGHDGTWPPTVSLSNLNGTNGFLLTGARRSFAGRAVSSAGDFNDDGFDDLIIGSFPAEKEDGIAYIVFGKKEPWPSVFSLSNLNGTNGFYFVGQPRSKLGQSVSCAGDVNADGISDIIIGAIAADEYNGAGYVVFGHKNPWPSTFSSGSLNGTNGFNLTGFVANSDVGYSVSGTGDVNGDRIDDIIIGAPNAHEDTGVSYVVFGHKGTWIPTISLSSLNGTNGFNLTGPAVNNFAGIAVSGAGDVNADGMNDLMIGSFAAAQSSGPAYIVFGTKRWSPTISLSSLNGTNGFVLTDIPATSDSLYSKVSGAGDFNNDSIDDVLVGGPGANNSTGTSYVVFGHKGSWPSALSVNNLNGTNGFVLAGITEGDQAGRSVRSAGDVNNDGINDIIIGAPAFSNSKPGAAYVVFGGLKPPRCNLTLSDGGEIHVKQVAQNEEKHKETKISQDKSLFSDDHNPEVSFQKNYPGRKILEVFSSQESSWNPVEWFTQGWQSFKTWLYAETPDKPLLSPVAQRLNHLKETCVRLQEEAPKGVHSYYHHALQDLIDDIEKVLKQPKTVTHRIVFKFWKDLKRIKKYYAVDSHLMQRAAPEHHPMISPTLSPLMFFNATTNSSLPTVQPQYLGN